MERWNVKGGELEYIDETHTYVYEGIVLPSITQMLKLKFVHKYDGVNPATLNRAAGKGTALHKAIEDYEQQGIESDLKELRNYKFLKKAYKFECLDNEVPVVLFDGGEPIAGGRLDLVLGENGATGLGDIKRTATLDKEYLAYQLNLYRLAYQQCYNTDITFLRGIHLRNDTRKYICLPVNENAAKGFINGFREVWENA